MEPLGPSDLAGARVQRVDTPRCDQVVLELRWGRDGSFQKGWLVLDSRGVVLADARPRGDAVDAFGKRLRKLLGNARLEAVETAGARTRVRLSRGGVSMMLAIDRGHPTLRDENGKPLAGRIRMRAEPPGEGFAPAAVRRGSPTASPKGPSVWARLGRKRAKTLRRTMQAIERDVQRVAEVPALRERASLLKAHAHEWQEGGELRVTDFYRDPPCERVIAVDPRLGPSAEADALFHRARRFERGAELGRARLREVREALDRLERWLEREPDAEAAADERAAWEAGAAEAGLRRQRAPGRREQRERRPFRRFAGAGERAILVGRGPADNDALTLRHARPWDLWLHAKGRRGAHVVVPLEKNESCPPDLLADAAMLAAHFSAAKDDSLVEVSFVPRRHVHKRKGDPPGAVRPSREKVFAVRMSGDRVRALLATEER